MANRFSYYRPIPSMNWTHPDTPWWIITDMGCILGRCTTEEHARRAVEALTADQAAGVLPLNVAKWDKAHLLSM